MAAMSNDPNPSELIRQRLSRQFRVALLLVLGSIVLVLVVNFFVPLVAYVECWAFGKATIYQFTFVHSMVGFTGLSGQCVATCGMTRQLTRRLSRLRHSLLDDRILP